MTTKHWLGTAALVLAIGTGSGVAFAQNQPETKHEEGRAGAAASSHETSRGEIMNRGEAKGGAAGERAASETKQGANEARGAAGSARDQAESREAKPAGGQSAQQSNKGERDQSAQRDREQHEGRAAKDASKDAESKQKQQSAAEERTGESKNAAETNKTDTNKAESNKAETNKAAQSGQQRQDREADRHDRNPANATQQSQDEHKGSGANQAADKQGADRNNNNQAAQSARPANTTTQQNSQTDTSQRNAAGQPQNNTAGQAQNQTDRGRSSTTVSVNDQQRTRVFDQLHRDREFDQARTDIDIRVNVGERLPERVRPRPLPSDIVSIVPEYRGYDYTVVHDEIAIIDPRSREIVDVIPQGGRTADRGYSGGYGSTRVTLSDEQRQMLFRSATATSTVGSTSASSGGSSSGSTCLTLRRVPDELAKSNPDLASYQYLAIGDQVILVDPQNQKVVQVIDQQQQSQQQ